MYAWISNTVIKADRLEIIFIKKSTYEFYNVATFFLKCAQFGNAVIKTDNLFKNDFYKHHMNLAMLPFLS